MNLLTFISHLTNSNSIKIFKIYNFHEFLFQKLFQLATRSNNCIIFIEGFFLTTYILYKMNNGPVHISDQ